MRSVRSWGVRGRSSAPPTLSWASSRQNSFLPVSEHMPSLAATLPDIDAPCASSDQPGKLRFLITISRADVEMRAELAGLWLWKLEYERGLQSAGSAAWRPDLDAASCPVKLHGSDRATVFPAKRRGNSSADASHGHAG